MDMRCACVGRERPTVERENASAGNRTRVTSMATMYSTTRPLMLDAGELK